MKKLLLGVLLVLLVFGCKDQSESVPEKEPLIMAKQSEMALLMNEMYAFNESIKTQIKKGNLTNSYPEHFNKIFSAELTDPSVRNAEFETNAKHFIQEQQSIFNNSGTDLNQLLTNYNNSVDACIGCHNVSCVGPIPRIKKLYINTK